MAPIRSCTTPTDVALRNRLYDRVGFTEGRRRLSHVLPAGTARAEVKERKNARLRRGEEGDLTQAGVVENRADELVNGRGLGILLRQHGTRSAASEHAANLQASNQSVGSMACVTRFQRRKQTSRFPTCR